MALPGQDAEVLYHIYGNWGYLELQSENSTDAKNLTLESLNQARILGSQWHAAIPISVLGIIELQQGNATEAYQQLSESLKIWREVGDPRGLVFCMLYLGAAASVLRMMETAESILQEGHDIAKAKMDHWAQAFSLDLLGQVWMFRAQPAEGYLRFKESQALFQEIGDQWGSTHALIHLADSIAEKGNHEEARQLFRSAYFTAREAKWIPVMIEALVYYARIDHEIPATKRLAIGLDVLTNASIPPHIQQQAERLRDEALAQLTPQQIARVRASRGQKSPETWAEEVFLQNDPDSHSKFGVA
jgi:tetratricopeptide (TPR) repeat protein